MNARLIFAISLSILLAIACTTSIFDKNNKKDFFPNEVSTFWEYTLIHADSDTASPNFPFPSNFITQITDKIAFNGSTYFQIENYYIPGPTFGNTIMVKKEDHNILISFNESDHLLYAFLEENSVWSLPIFTNESMTNTHDYWARISSFSDDKIVIQWGVLKNIERSHLLWEEHFQKGVGRTKIVSQTQAYGKTIWELTNTNVQQ